MSRIEKNIFKIAKGVVVVSNMAGGVAFIKERVDQKVHFKRNHQGFYEYYIKRPLDCTLATGAIIVLSPVLLLTAIIVHVKLGSPIIFKQERAGKYEKPFSIVKFRSMTIEHDKNGILLPDELRLTALGRILRSTSIDELPELFNILKGDMSIVGPRPLPTGYSQFYTEIEKKRFQVRGGLIPSDSIDKNSVISWDKQFKYESDYAENVRFKTDLYIFLNAVRIVLERNRTNYGAVVRKSLIDERFEKNSEGIIKC